MFPVIELCGTAFERGRVHGEAARARPALPLEARIETVASVVMQLGAGIMHVAAGVPSLVSYEPVPLAAEPALLS